MRALIWTQEAVRWWGVIRVLLGFKSRYGTRERPVNVVRWRGSLYLEDGHHRTFVARLLHRRVVRARVFEELRDG